MRVVKGRKTMKKKRCSWWVGDDDEEGMGRKEEGERTV